MKITSGKFRGIHISSPRGIETRPTLSKTRQAVFNMLRPYLDGALCIDIFAGTGAYGFEALSNGAEKAYFTDLKTAATIKENASKLKLERGSYEVSATDFEVSLRKYAGQGISADIVFADPPYNRGFARKILKLAASSDILKKDGLLVLEIHRDEEPEDPEGFEIIKRKEYGETLVFVLKKNARGG